MAGGMTPGGSGSGETLLQRVENTRANEAARRGHSTADFHRNPPSEWADALRDKPPTTPATPPPVKHCWYDGPHGRQAALLLGWRNTGGLFHGRIAVATLQPDGWAIVEMVVEQGMLSPA